MEECKFLPPKFSYACKDLVNLYVPNVRTTKDTPTSNTSKNRIDVATSEINSMPRQLKNNSTGTCMA